MTCPTAVAARQSDEVDFAPDASHFAIDVRLVVPFDVLRDDAPPADVILTELRDALESEGLDRFLDLCHETSADLRVEYGDLQLFDAGAPRG